MRAYGLRRALRRRCADDRGAVLIIVAVFAIVSVVMLAAVVDLGGLRQEKREVTLSTDAAALAAVQSADFTLVSTAMDCSAVPTNLEARLQEPTHLFVDDVVRKFLDANGGSMYDACEVVPDGLGSGYVTVAAKDSVQYAFGKAIGQTSGSVNGKSAAAFTLDLGGGLRPVGVCEATMSLDTPPKDFELLLAPLATTGASAPAGNPHFDITLPVEKLNDTDAPCGSASGHFGQIDFADSGNGQGNCDPTKVDKLIEDSYCEYLFNGWFGDLPSDQVFSGDPGSNYSGTTGMFDNLRDEVGHFFIPVYDEVIDCKVKPKPSECSTVKGAPFHITYYVEVELDSYCLDGSKRSTCVIERDVDGSGSIDNDERFRWFEFDVYRVISAAGLTQLPKTSDAEPIPARICAVDSDLTYC